MDVRPGPADRTRSAFHDNLLKAIAGTILTLIMLMAAGLLIFGGLGLRDTAVLAPLPWMQAVSQSFFMLAALAIALLLFGRYRALGGAWVFWTGAAFLAFGILNVFYLLTWPGLVGDGSIIARLPNTSTWIGDLTVLCIALLAVTVNLRWPQRLSPSRAILGYGVMALVSASAALLCILFEERLPVLLADGQFTTLALIRAVVGLPMVGLASVLAYRRYLAEKDSILGYQVLFLVIITFGVLFSFAGGKRYDVWWYASRFVYVSSTAALLFGLLQEGYRIFAKERERLEEREQVLERLREQHKRLQEQAWEIARQERELKARNQELLTTNKAIVEAQSSLAESEHRYRSLFEQMDEGFVVCEVIYDEKGQPYDFRCLDVNPAFERQTGLTRAVVGRTAREVLPTMALEGVDAFRAVALTGQAVRFEGYGRFLGRWCEMIVFSPQQGHIATLFIDIDARKKAEAEREELLAAAQKGHEKMEETLHLIAHDLRQPVTTADGHLQLLSRSLERGDRKQTQRSLEALTLSVRRLDGMIADLVESVRLEIGQATLDQQMLDLGEVVEFTLRSLFADQARHRVNVEREEPLPVFADRLRLERVVNNLVGNALKYSDPGKEVNVTLIRRDEKAVVSVTDQGRGIDPEDLPHIFERAYRAKTAGKAEGLGLGLYICRMIVEAHGGQVWAESELGKGSTFSFAIPLA